MDETVDLLTIALTAEVGPRTVRELCLRASLAEVLAHPDEHADLLPPRARAALASGAARRTAEAEARRVAALGMRVVGRDESQYPPLLREIYDPPPVLWVKGRLFADEGPGVGIVGARAASPQGRALARGMAHDLASAGATIVSGLARGIDTAAHEGALDSRGRTVAVLGSGLDRVYPRENARLAEAIAERGAVVSEFRLGTEPHPGNFPRRNRVIAGWGRLVVVVEAGERSGALVTARAALEEGRDVLAVPGHPTQAASAGTNQLIRDGAPLVRDARDVAAEMGLVIPVTVEEASPGDDVLRLLRRDMPQSLEEIRERSGRPVAELLSRLTELEMAEKVRRLPGALFVRQ